MFWALFLPFALFSWSSHLAPFPLLEAIKHYCVLQICLSQLPVKDAQDIRKLYPELYSCQHNLGRKWAKPRWMQKSLPGPYSSQSKITEVLSILIRVLLALILYNSTCRMVSAGRNKWREKSFRFLKGMHYPLELGNGSSSVARSSNCLLNWCISRIRNGNACRNREEGKASGGPWATFHWRTKSLGHKEKWRESWAAASDRVLVAGMRDCSFQPRSLFD